MCCKSSLPRTLHLLPVSGRFDPRAGFPETHTGLLLIDTLIDGSIPDFLIALRYMIIPAFCQSLLVIAVVTRQLRGDMLDIVRKDFVMVARANGIPERVIWTRYLMKNALISTVSMLGFLIGFELGGSVLIEYVLDWPGIGQYALKAALLLDFQPIMGATLFIGCDRGDRQPDYGYVVSGSRSEDWVRLRVAIAAEGLNPRLPKT